MKKYLITTLLVILVVGAIFGVGCSNTATSPVGQTSTEQRIAELERQVATLQQEIDILRKINREEENISSMLREYLRGSIYWNVADAWIQASYNMIGELNQQLDELQLNP